MDPIIRITGSGRRRTVTVDGRPIPLAKWSSGSCYYDDVTDLFIKVGARRARRERKVWARAVSLGITHHLAPIAYSGSNWNAFHRVKKCSFVRTPDRETIAELLFRMLRLHDNHGKNWTRDERGIVVLVDYEA